MTKNKVTKRLLMDDGGFRITVRILRQLRIRRKMSVARLSRVSGIAIEMINKIEAEDFEETRVKDLLLFSKALGWHAGVALAPIRDEPPKDNTAILDAYDRLIRSGRAVVFLKDQPDKKHPGITWDVVGDPRRNWLYSVCTNRTKRLRYGALTDNPGGWAIGGQRFGIDVETERIARGMSSRLWRKHRTELIRSATRRPSTT